MGHLRNDRYSQRQKFFFFFFIILVMNATDVFSIQSKTEEDLFRLRQKNGCNLFRLDCNICFSAFIRVSKPIGTFHRSSKLCQIHVDMLKWSNSCWRVKKSVNSGTRPCGVVHFALIGKGRYISRETGKSLIADWTNVTTSVTRLARVQRLRPGNETRWRTSFSFHSVSIYLFITFEASL